MTFVLWWFALITKAETPINFLDRQGSNPIKKIKKKNLPIKPTETNKIFIIFVRDKNLRAQKGIGLGSRSTTINL